MSPSLPFLIEIIQKDVAQQGRKRSALGHSSGGFIQPSADDPSGPEVSSDKTENAFMPDPPGDPTYQDVVIHRIKGSYDILPTSRVSLPK
jgi:hypothetical protein